MKKIIFLTGHRKSGTSLLLSLFDNHPDLNIFPVDFTFFYSYFPIFIKKKLNKKKLLKRVSDIYKSNFKKLDYDARYNKLKINNSIRNIKKNFTLKDLLSKKKFFFKIIKEWLRQTKSDKNKNLVVKETSQLIYFNDYNKIFKNLRMINIIRDPRDNFSSIKSGQKKYYRLINENYTTSFFSFLYRYKSDLTAANILKNNKNYLNVRYEDLVNNTKIEMKKISKFLNIKYQPSLLEPTLLGKKYLGNNFDNKLFGISKKNTSNWKKRISQDEIKIIEYFLSDLMKIWNYKKQFKLSDTVSSHSKFYEKINSKYFFNDGIKFKLKKNNN